MDRHGIQRFVWFRTYFLKKGTIIQYRTLSQCDMAGLDQIIKFSIYLCHMINQCKDSM